MKYTQQALDIFKSNLGTKWEDEDRRTEFIKQLKASLRYDYGMPATKAYRLNPNKTISYWYDLNKADVIGGAMV